MLCFTCYITDESCFVGWIKRSGSTFLRLISVDPLRLIHPTATLQAA